MFKLRQTLLQFDMTTDLLILCYILHTMYVYIMYVVIDNSTKCPHYAMHIFTRPYKVYAFWNVHFWCAVYKVSAFCILNKGLLKVTVWRLQFIIMFNINEFIGCWSWRNNVRNNICVKVYLKNIIFLFLFLFFTI